MNSVTFSEIASAALTMKMYDSLSASEADDLKSSKLADSLSDESIDKSLRKKKETVQSAFVLEEPVEEKPIAKKPKLRNLSSDGEDKENRHRLTEKMLDEKFTKK